MAQLPQGIKLIHWISSKLGITTNNSIAWYKLSILTLTFISYTCYHASRKPLSVVKSYFNRSCDGLIPDIPINDSNKDDWCNWAPFVGPNVVTILGALDSAFLFAYAIAMFFSGFIAERISLRYFLAIGMILSGISCYLFGVAHNLNIHFLSYYIIVQAFGGVVQSTGWPGVVAVMGNWFGKNKRGVIFGIWNSHTSFGNILGTLVANYFLEYDWGLSFIIPGLIIAVAGGLNALFLIESPNHVIPEVAICDLQVDIDAERSESSDSQSDDSATSDTELLLQKNARKRYIKSTEASKEKSNSEEAIGLIDALRIPGVIEFSLCLFFAKLVSYTMLYWLPFYIEASTKLSAIVSTIFDVGGIVGGIAAGLVCDITGKSALTTAAYNVFGGSVSFGMHVILLSIVGFFVNGPYALITTAVSAELGCHESLSGNSKALATVSAIIDGTGSIGAAIGPLIAGVLFSFGWSKVLYMLIFANAVALLMITRLLVRELFPSRTSL